MSWRARLEKASWLAAAGCAWVLFTSPWQAAAQPPAAAAPAAVAIPDRPAPEARYLIFITHGWNSNANVWANAMAVAMLNTIPAAERFQWHIVAYDWANRANTWTPGGAAGNARAIGAQLAAQVTAPFPGGYDRVHVIGHSAGSHLVNALVNGIPDDRPVQITLLDAYEPNGGGRSNLGRRTSLFATTFCEQFVDANEDVIVGNPTCTNETLRFACNHDITALDDRNVNAFAQHHAWPWVFYQRTVVAPDGPDAANTFGYGFKLSIALSPALAPPSHGDCPAGTRTIYAPLFEKAAPVVAAAESIYFEGPRNVTGRVASPTGTVVNVGAYELRLSTGPGSEPVWVTLDAANYAHANYIAFDWQFLTQAGGAKGWLAAYVDRQRDHAVDEHDLVFQEGEPYVDPGLHAPEFVPLQQDTSFATIDLPPGTTKLAFRVDPMSAQTSTVMIRNIRFGWRDRTVSDVPGGGGSDDLAALAAVHPNPSTGSVWIELSLRGTTHAQIGVYDARGTLVRRIADEVLAPARATFAWDGRGSEGRPVPNGIYFIRCNSAGNMTTAKVVIAR